MNGSVIPNTNVVILPEGRGFASVIPGTNVVILPSTYTNDKKE